MAFKMRGWTPKGDKKMFGGKSPAYTKKSIFKRNDAFMENQIDTPIEQGENEDVAMVFGQGGDELNIAKKNKDFLKGEKDAMYAPGDEPQILELSAERAEELLKGIKRGSAPKEYLEIIKNATSDGSKTAEFHYAGKKYLDKDKTKLSRGKGSYRHSGDTNVRGGFDTKFYDWLRKNQNRPEEKIKLEPTMPGEIATGLDEPTIERGKGLTPSVSIDAPIEKPELRSVGTRKKEVSFGDAFKEARAGGKAEFTWKGKRFHSRRADETNSQWRDKIKKIQDNLTVNK
jgi:hypothetical protein